MKVGCVIFCMNHKESQKHTWEITVSKATSLGREPSPIELFVETHVQSKDCQKGVQHFVDNRA